ncbi:hypothetical protein DH2020_009467 [Rehmannia glutinosa]|uniref:Denticleless protein n=1 Tax=Rehmannia glutinosa TaxID=99300 RepID=A0ABR0X983_REHGL
MGNESQELDPVGAVAVEHRGEPSPPMALSFCKTNKNAHILALTDESGYITLFNTRKRFMDSSSYQENAEKAKVYEWVAHENAIFDLCWIKDDANILTASGDQSIKIWDTQEQKCIRALMGHTGSIKSISCHPSNPELVVSGSRDGSFAVWDTSYESKQLGEKELEFAINVICCGVPKSSSDEVFCRVFVFVSVVVIVKSLPLSDVSVCDQKNSAFTIHIKPHTFHILFLLTTRYVVVDAVDKPSNITALIWTDDKTFRRAESRSITSVLYLKDEVSVATAGAVDSVIKFWDTRHLKDPATPVTYACPNFESSAESAISPDAAHILSGSSDGNAYIWQVNKPQLDPITLKSHDGEVTAVDWEGGNFLRRFHSSLMEHPRQLLFKYAISIINEKRVRAFPRIERRKLFSDEPSCTKSDPDTMHRNVVCHVNSPPPIRTPAEISTPESQKKKMSLTFEVKENLDRTPEAEMKSPSSVLNPPSSLKRKTIRDYFPVS